MKFHKIQKKYFMIKFVVLKAFFEPFKQLRVFKESSIAILMGSQQECIYEFLELS